MPDTIYKCRYCNHFSLNKQTVIDHEKQCVYNPANIKKWVRWGILRNMKKELVLSLSKEKGDFRIETFRSGGNGGQHQNTTDSGARVIHVVTGLSAESRTERSQKQNIKIAFKNLVNKPEFKKWLRLETARRAGRIKTDEEIRKEIEEQIQEKHLKVEVQKEGKWVKEDRSIVTGKQIGRAHV